MGTEQTSGSITFDTGALTAGVLAAITPVIEQMNQVIGQINANITRLGEVAGIATLSRPGAGEVLTDSLPAGLRCEQMRDGGTPQEIAVTILDDLERRGYLLVAYGKVVTIEPVPAIESPTESLRERSRWFDQASDTFPT